MKVIGVISDTHGLLRPQALAQLAGVAAIVHAGDIGGPEILDELAQIAPVTAVRGNNDVEHWAEDVPHTALLELEDRALYVLHDINDLKHHPPPRKVDVIIAGHSHKPLIHEQDGVLYLNPGSAGPRRFKLPISLAKLFVNKQEIRAELIELTPSTATAAPPRKRKRSRTR